MNLVELGYLAGWRITRAVPKPLAAAVFRLGADRAHRRGGPGVRRLATNLRQVVGPDLPPAEFDQLVRRGLRSYARYWLELFRLPSLSHAQRLSTFRLVGEELLAADVAAGRGAVIALPHGGNWDAAGAWVAAKGWPITTVAERLKPEAVYTRFLAFRQQLGMEIIPLTGGQQPPFDVLADRLGKGHVVPLLADRDLTRRGDRGALLRRPYPDAGRTGAARAAYRRTALRRLDVVRIGHGGRRADRPAGVAGPGQRHPRPSGYGCSPSRSPTIWRPVSPGIRKTGTCCSGCGWPRRIGRQRTQWHQPPPVRPEGGGRSADRHRVPVLLRRAGRGAEPHHGPGRGADRSRTRGERAGPGGRGFRRCRRTWCRPVVRCRCPYNGSVARITFGPVSTARVRRWLARGDFDVLHVHEPFDAESVAARRALRARAGGGHLPHRDDPVPGARRGAGHAADRAGADHRPDRGQRAGPQGAGGAPRTAARWRSPTGWRWRSSPTRSRCRAGRGSVARAPAARSVSSVGSPSRARASRCSGRRSWRWPPSAPGCGCWWPARVIRRS